MGKNNNNNYYYKNNGYNKPEWDFSIHLMYFEKVREYNKFMHIQHYTIVIVCCACVWDIDDKQK